MKQACNATVMLVTGGMLGCQSVGMLTLRTCPPPLFGPAVCI